MRKATGNQSAITLLIVFLAAGCFPQQAHRVINLAAAVVGGVNRNLTDIGISPELVTWAVVVGMVVVTVLSLGAAMNHAGNFWKGEKRK